MTHISSRKQKREGTMLLESISEELSTKLEFIMTQSKKVEELQGTVKYLTNKKVVL